MNRVILTVIALFTLPVMAGSEQAKQASFEPERIVAFAKGVERYAAQHGARAFVIARVGRPADTLPEGVRFTHTAIAVYSNITLDSGDVVQGYAIHNLYQQSGEPGRSMLVTDYPVDFLWGVNRLQAGILIPSPQVQTRLIELISSGQSAELHNPKYSVLASPYNDLYQNCTEYTLDMLNAAIYQTTDRARLKANAKAYFEAQRIHTSPFKLMLVSALMDDVTLRDHKGKVKTATFTTLSHYLDAYGLAEQSVVLSEALQPSEV